MHVSNYDVPPLTIENNVQYLAAETEIIPPADEQPDELDTCMKFTWLSEKVHEHHTQISKDLINTSCSKV